MANITGAELCKIIKERELEDAEFHSENDFVYTVNNTSKTVTVIHLHTQEDSAWPGIADWPDNFDELPYDEQDSIVDTFEDRLSICTKSDEPFERVQIVPLSMFECFYCME